MRYQAETIAQIIKRLNSNYLQRLKQIFKEELDERDL